MSPWRALIAGVFVLGTNAALAEATSVAARDCSSGDREVGILSRQQPYYPHSATLFCLSGHVKASFTIDRDGRTRDIAIVESDPPGVFDRSTVDTISRWRFAPACRDGERVKREATQTIEFRLPDAERASCATVVDALDGPTADLLAEIGARYALLANYWRTGDDRDALETAIEEPLGDFEGDLGRVAAFHRRALERFADTTTRGQLDELFGETVVALMPRSLADDPTLDRAHALFDRTRAAFERHLETQRETHRQLTEAYRQLQREAQLDDRILGLLIVPFVGNPDVPFKQAARAPTESLDKLERILDLLQSRPGQWAVLDGELRFERAADQEIWDARWEAFLTHRDRIETAAVDRMRSFQDYLD
jgi:TonB family protein